MNAVTNEFVLNLRWHVVNSHSIIQCSFYYRRNKATATSVAAAAEAAAKMVNGTHDDEQPDAEGSDSPTEQFSDALGLSGEFKFTFGR